MTNSKRQPYVEGGVASLRQPFFLGKIAKKIGKGVKKIVKSPVGKAALLGGLGLWGANKAGGIGNLWNTLAKTGLGKWVGGLTPGQRILGGLGIAAVGTPLWQKMMKTGPYAEVEEEEDWSIQPSSIANIIGEAKDYYRNYDPYRSSLNYMSPKWAVDPTFYSAKGGLAKLANGGGVAEAQAEQMLKMEYQKYRNQGGTMSYQQFKMQVLKQAQQQGPMAQGPRVPQMAAEGGRMGYLFGKKVGVAHASPNVARSGNFKDNIMNLFSNKLAGRNTATSGSPVATSKSFMGSLVPQTFKDQDADYQAYLDSGSELPYHVWKTSRQTVAQGGRVPAQEGGLMDMGGMEKDYRNEGGFVPIGGKERADDVPARLSKNEFVFTADAVRNAGGGDIDAGAEIMENVMKNLEAGGQISEESQGAQGMYNNMKQLETRIA